MNVYSLILFFLTISLVNFCESQNPYHFDSEYCQLYMTKTNGTTYEVFSLNQSESSVHNEMKFQVKSYNFKIVLVQEKNNQSSWVFIEIKNNKRDRFRVNFGASRNPDLNPDLIDYSYGLIGSFEKISNGCLNIPDSFPNLRVKWKPPYTPFFGQINLYFQIENDRPFGWYSFRKFLSFNVKSQKTKEDENIVDPEVTSEKPKSYLVESTGIENSSNVWNFAVPIAIISIGIYICIFWCLFMKCCFTEDPPLPVSVVQWRRANSQIVHTERCDVGNTADIKLQQHQQQHSELWSITGSCETRNEKDDLPPSYDDLFDMT